MTLVLIIALAGGAGGTWLARRLAWRIGMVSNPNPIVPQHVQRVAYLGGVGIAIGIACGSAAARLANVDVPKAILVAAFAFAVLGTFDDARPLRPLAKLAAQLAIATTYAVCSTSGGWLEVAVATLWIVAIVNAVNLTDVCDGLVSALAVTCLIAVGVVTHGGFAWTVAFASAGFWLFNRAPATIFLGDGGSHLLGFALAASWLAAWQANPTWPRAIAAVIGAAIFIIELGFLIVVRRRRGIPFWRGSPDHLALRLQAAGFTKNHTVAIALIPTVVLSFSAVWLATTGGIAAATLGIASIVAIVWLVVELHAREPIPRAGRPREEDLA